MRQHPTVRAGGGVLCSECRWKCGTECRRHSPTTDKQGFSQFPIVRADGTQWCGDGGYKVEQEYERGQR